MEAGYGPYLVIMLSTCTQCDNATTQYRNNAIKPHFIALLCYVIALAPYEQVDNAIKQVDTPNHFGKFQFRIFEYRLRVIDLFYRVMVLSVYRVIDL